VIKTNLDTGLNRAIRYYRRSLNMSQQDLARIMEVRHPTVSWWETGRAKPSIDNLIIMAKIFGVSELELLHPTLTDEMEEPYKRKLRRTVRTKA